MGVKDPNKKYDMTEMARGDVIVAATGVTDGALLHGVRFGKEVITTETIVYRSPPAPCAASTPSTGSCRSSIWIERRSAVIPGPEGEPGTHDAASFEAAGCAALADCVFMGPGSAARPGMTAGAHPGRTRP